MAVFVALHIADTVLVWFAPSVFNHMMAFYRHPLIRVGEIGIVAAVIYHAINGLRITACGLWPELYHRQKLMLQTEAALFGAVFAPIAYIMVRTLVR